MDGDEQDEEARFCDWLYSLLPSATARDFLLTPAFSCRRPSLSFQMAECCGFLSPSWLRDDCWANEEEYTRRQTAYFRSGLHTIDYITAWRN